MAKVKISFFAVCALFAVTCQAQDIVNLPPPNRVGGLPLMDALNQRQSCREFMEQDLDQQLLSDLLWAAFGFNRPDKRTAPSANNRQEFLIYVVDRSGAYLWDPLANILLPLAHGDLRFRTGRQDFVKVAALSLVYVAQKGDNYSRETANVDVGFIAQNVYLFCASMGLGTVVRGWFDAAEVSDLLGLGDDQVPILTQTVGFPAHPL